jgi:5-methylcytosine-specific restriction enzyme A
MSVKTLSLSTVRTVKLGMAGPAPTERIRGGTRQRRNYRLFMRQPLCVRCLEEGATRVVDVWDHIVALADGGADDESNLQGLCADHHDAKSAAEATERAGGVGRV